MHYAGSSLSSDGPHTAVLVLCLDILSPTVHGPFIMHATITGPNPATMGGMRYAEIARVCGSSWSDAKAKMMAHIERDARWILPILAR